MVRNCDPSFGFRLVENKMTSSGVIQPKAMKLEDFDDLFRVQSLQFRRHAPERS